MISIQRAEPVGVDHNRIGHSTASNRCAIVLAKIIAAVTAPILVLGILSTWVSVSTAYLFAAAPFFFLGAGYFLDQLAAEGTKRRIEWLVVPACVLALLANSAPKLLSHYRDGGRIDLREAARYLRNQIGQNDMVLTDQPKTLRYYLHGTTIKGFPRNDPHQLLARRSELTTSDPKRTLWIVVGIRRRGGFNELDSGMASDWLRSRCRLVASIGKPRLDFKFNGVEVYRCDEIDSIVDR